MENRKYEQVLIQQAKLQNRFYSYTVIQPCAYFWKQLVKGKQTPSVMVPDTLILNDKQSALIWIYTNSKGKLQKSTNINLKDFVNKVTNYCSPNQLSATLKRVTYNDNYINGNEVKLLNCRYLQNASLQQLGGQSQALITLQRYVKSNGNNPFICRTIWKKQKRSQCFIITNKKSYYDETQLQAKRFLVKVAQPSRGQPSPSTIVKTIQGKHLTETCKYLTAITDFMKLYRGIIFSQIVGDFIKDQSGNWWLINIKAFQIQSKCVKSPGLTEQKQPSKGVQASEYAQKQSCPQPYEKEKYQKTKICRYCQKYYLQSQLNHLMTIRMLIQTDRYLLHLGKNYKWLRRSDILNVDSHCLYQQHKICQRCHRLYMEIQHLMEVENQFLKSLGFQMDKKPKQLLMSLTNQQQLKTQSKNKQLIALASCSKKEHNMNSLNRQEVQGLRGNIPQRSEQMEGNSPERSEQLRGDREQRSEYMGFPKTIQLGPNSNIVFEEDVPVKNDHMINKMIRYRMILYLKQLDQIQFPDFLTEDYRSYHFYLDYQLFGVKNKIKLNFNHHFNPRKSLLKIRKLKINYFFSHSPSDVLDYLNSQNDDFYIKLYVESRNNSKTWVFESNGHKSLGLKKKNSPQPNLSQGSVSQDVMNSKPQSQQTRQQKRVQIGKLRLPIKQFFNSLIGQSNRNKITKKDFYKFFSVNEVSHGWGLDGSIGIIPSQSYVNTSRMVFFTQDNLIYLPNDNYYYCEHLPEQWIDVIKKQLNDNQKQKQYTRFLQPDEVIDHTQMNAQQKQNNKAFSKKNQPNNIMRTSNTKLKTRFEAREMFKDQHNQNYNQIERADQMTQNLQSQHQQSQSDNQTSKQWKNKVLQQQIGRYQKYATKNRK